MTEPPEAGKASESGPDPIDEAIGRKGRGLEKHLELLRSRPFFDVELSSLCNLRCPVCPREAITREAGLMTGETIEALRRWIPAGARVAFSGLGEPLMNPSAALAAAALKSAGAEVGLVTNATLLGRAAAEALIEAGIDFLELSYPYFDANGACAKGLDFKGYEAKVSEFAALKPASVKAYLSITLPPGNAGMLPKARAFAKSHRLTPLVRPLHSRGGALYAPGRAGRDAGCGVFAKVSFVAWNGDLLACCNDVSGSTKLGNIRDTGFEDLLRLKECAIRQGSLFAPCASCDDSHRASLLDKPLPRGF